MTPVEANLEARGLRPLAEHVAREYHVTLDELLGNGRGMGESHARHVMWAVLRARGHWSWARLGMLFCRDHTTIMAGVKRVPGPEIARFAEKEAVHA